MTEKNEYIYKGLELVRDEQEQILTTEVKIICYHITKDKFYPFLRFMLCRNNSVIPTTNDAKFFFPTLHLENVDAKYLHTSIYSLIPSHIIQQYTEKSNIVVEGSFYTKNARYIFVDISMINIDGIYLDAQSDMWFALSNEIINNKHICKVPISYEVSQFFTSYPDFLRLLDLKRIKVFPSPEVCYIGCDFEKTTFQSVFGSKHFHGFKFELEDAIKDGGWSQHFKPQYRGGKLITENEYGRYIRGGVNRMAVLMDKIYYIDLDIKICDDIDDFIQNIFLSGYDSIILHKNGESLGIVKDLDQQVSLSYHKINKWSLSDQWSMYKKYDIE